MNTINQFDIAYVDLSGAVGSEQSNIRPCVIVQNDIGNKYSPTVIVMPLTSAKKKLLPVHVMLLADKTPSLQKDSIVLAEQVRTIDKRRVLETFARVEDREEQNRILAAYVYNIIGIPAIRAEADKLVGMFNG